jgi:Type II secretion system (T2SS), protein E, N-terminal domain
MTQRVPIGERLKRAGHIDAWQLQSAIAHQRNWGGRLGEALVGLGFVPEKVVLAEVARQLEVPFVEIRDRRVPYSTVDLVPAKLIRSRRVFPLAVNARVRRSPIVLATAEPQNLAVLDEVRFATGMAVQPVLVSERDLDGLITNHLDGPKPAPRPVPRRAPPPSLPHHAAPFALVPFPSGVN